MNEVWILALTTALSWYDAKNECVLKGGQLLPISGQETYDRFNDIAAAYPGVVRRDWDWDYYWVGANDITTESTWVNVDGSPTTPLQWKAAEPGNSPGEDCGQLLQSYGSPFQLGDANCDLSGFLKHVCHYKLP